MRLETERLIIRDYEESDRDDYFRLKSDSETMYYLQDIKVSTRRESDEEFDQVLQDAKQKKELSIFSYRIKRFPRAGRKRRLYGGSGDTGR